MLLLLEMCVGLILTVFFVSQIIIPGFSKNLHFFWLFRKSKIEEAANELYKLEEDYLANELKKVVEERKRNINYQENEKDGQ